MGWKSSDKLGAHRITMVLAGIAIALMAQGAAADLDREQLTTLSSSLVKVEAVDAEGRLWLGTGVQVAPERVVTSCHVTRPAEDIRVRYRGGTLPAVAQSADTEHDLCILSVPGLDVKPAKVGRSNALRVGEPVWALGYEGGYALKIRGGIVRALHALDGASVVESTTPFTSGASGGALFDEDGQLVGILTYRLRGDRRSYFAVPVEWFAARVLADRAYQAVAPLQGALPFWQRPIAELPFFLRAHQLETGGDWGGLITLTDEWSKVDSESAEAWLFRGRGLAETQDPSSARRALQRALVLDPVYSAALLQLGRLSAHSGALEEANDALARLNRLNPKLAHCLAVEMQTNGALADDTAIDPCAAI
ncbi:MAG: tetratricopeptide repeat-containing serine protease family protein [Betaproteobacteria bacterium]